MIVNLVIHKLFEELALNNVTSNRQSIVLESVKVLNTLEAKEVYGKKSS